MIPSRPVRCPRRECEHPRGTCGPSSLYTVWADRSRHPRRRCRCPSAAAPVPGRVRRSQTPRRSWDRWRGTAFRPSWWTRFDDSREQDSTTVLIGKTTISAGGRNNQWSKYLLLCVVNKQKDAISLYITHVLSKGKANNYGIKAISHGWPVIYLLGRALSTSESNESSVHVGRWRQG